MVAFFFHQFQNKLTYYACIIFIIFVEINFKDVNETHPTFRYKIPNNSGSYVLGIKYRHGY